MFRISTPQQADKLRAFIGKQLEAHDVRVEVEKWRNARSVPANNRYWLLTTMAAQEAGLSKEEMHQQNCGDFFGWTEGELFGKPYRRPARTTTSPDVLDSKAFAEFSTWAEQRYIDFFGVWLE